MPATELDDWVIYFMAKKEFEDERAEKEKAKPKKTALEINQSPRG